MKIKEVLLASASERRADILKSFGIDFIASPCMIEERIDKEDPTVTVLALAFEKAWDVFKGNRDKLVIGADTVVYLDEVLGKPANEAEARTMLQKISGKTHRVYTGVALLGAGAKEIFYECSEVRIRDLSAEAIDAYIRTGEPMGKAGGYAVQGFGASLVESIKGDYFNVVGLPVGRLIEKLNQTGA